MTCIDYWFLHIDCRQRLHLHHNQASEKENKMSETINKCVREGDTTWEKLTQKTTNECQMIIFK